MQVYMPWTQMCVCGYDVAPCILHIKSHLFTAHQGRGYIPTLYARTEFTQVK